MLYGWSRKFQISAIALIAGLLASSVLAADAPSADLIAKGRYLATAGDCQACHTAKGSTPYAGGLVMKTPFGTLSTPNITPDRETGIGEWSDDEFYRALHDGVGRHGEYLYFAMPYPWYTKVTREDVLAIKAYLFSLPPVKKPRVANHLVFPANIRESQAAWRELFFKPATFEPDPKQTTQVNRGAYLVEGLGHCGECHNGRLLAATSSKFQKSLQGGVINDWYAPNITSDMRDGIGAWSHEQLVQYLKTGAAPGKGVAAGPMAEAIGSLSQLHDDDLAAIAAYLKATPPASSERAVAVDNEGGSAPGAQAYLSNCASCHGVDGKGIAGIVPPLAGNGSVTAQGPQNVIQVVLGGLPARQDYAPMLAIGAAMSDADIAEVTNYVRRAWGNEAPATASANMVYDLRATIDTPMNGAPKQGCPAVSEPALAKALADTRKGIGQRLQSTNELNMPQQVQEIVAKVKAAAPSVKQTDGVNGLTSAYCQVVRRDSRLDANSRALQLGHFSQLIDMQWRSNGIAADGSNAAMATPVSRPNRH